MGRLKYREYLNEPCYYTQEIFSPLIIDSGKWNKVSGAEMGASVGGRKVVGTVTETSPGNRIKARVRPGAWQGRMTPKK